MEIVLNTIQTIALLIAFILLGCFIKSKVPILNKYYIPAPFIGGLLLAVLMNLLSSKLKLTIDFSLFTVFFAGFFASVGLRVDKKIFRKGILKQLFFLFTVLFVAVMQNIFIIIFGRVFGLSKSHMLVFSSLNLVGDASLAHHAIELVGNDNGTFLPMLSGVSVFCIIIAIFSCSFMFKLLESKTDFSDAVKPSNPVFAFKELLIYLLLLFTTTGIAYLPTQLGYGHWLSPLGGGLLAGIVIRLVLDKFNIFKIEFFHMNFLGNIFLSLLLVTGFASLRLADLKEITPWAILIVFLQMAWLMAFSYFIVFKLFGKNSIAAYVATGLTGIGIGFPPNSLSSIQSFSEENGVIPDLIFIIPPIGSWLIGVINPYIVHLFF